jgi:hypothetical protein
METTVENNLNVEITQGEIKIIFKDVVSGKVSFAQAGLNDNDLVFEGGLVRIVFDFTETNGKRNFFSVPTLEVSYVENMGETHWICDFNEATILDKLDHQGHSTIMLMSRKKIQEHEHHHQNQLVMHAEFPQAVHIKADQSYFHFFN